LPGARSFRDTGRVLAGTRNAVAWGALGHATAAYEAAIAYCRERQQFGKPLVSFQIVQDKLVKMLAEVCSMQLYCLRLGRLIEEGRLTDTIAAIAKMNNTRKARQVIAEARDLLGGNGILLDFHVIRHMADIEAIHTYEGTETIQTLIVGRDITGASAFARRPRNPVRRRRRRADTHRGTRVRAPVAYDHGTGGKPRARRAVRARAGRARCSGGQFRRAGDRRIQRVPLAAADARHRADGGTPARRAGLRRRPR